MSEFSDLPCSESVQEVVRRMIGVDPAAYALNIEIINRAKDPDAYDRARKSFENALSLHNDPSSVLRRTYFGDHFGIYIECIYPLSDVDGLDEKHKMYYPVCTLAEIARIILPHTAEDYLLKMRADAVVESARLTRVFIARREKALEGWSLTSYFDRTRFANYMGRLSPDDALKCGEVAAGTCLLREPNGMCIRTPRGNLIVVSEVLEIYLYYMNVFLLMQGRVPMGDRLSAFLIAVRTMLLTESPDFDLDPRGQLPHGLHVTLTDLVESQVNFVIGHEFGHHILGHLADKADLRNVAGMLPSMELPAEAKYYTPRQHQEFDADVAAVLLPSYSDKEAAEVLDGATCFFAGLVLFEAVSEYISPKIRRMNTHPESVERIFSLRRRVFEKRVGIKEFAYDEGSVNEIIGFVDHWKDRLLKEWVPYHVEELEMYGSVYMPSYRGGDRIDRVDF